MQCPMMDADVESMDPGFASSCSLTGCIGLCLAFSSANIFLHVLRSLSESLLIQEAVNTLLGGPWPLQKFGRATEPNIRGASSRVDKGPNKQEQAIALPITSPSKALRSRFVYPTYRLNTSFFATVKLVFDHAMTILMDLF